MKGRPILGLALAALAFALATVFLFTSRHGAAISSNAAPPAVIDSANEGVLGSTEARRSPAEDPASLAPAGATAAEVCPAGQQPRVSDPEVAAVIEQLTVQHDLGIDFLAVRQRLLVSTDAVRR